MQGKQVVANRILFDKEKMRVSQNVRLSSVIRNMSSTRTD
jgi:hypothetical protein